jgi:hypothetical protein
MLLLCTQLLSPQLAKKSVSSCTRCGNTQRSHGVSGPSKAAFHNPPLVVQLQSNGPTVRCVLLDCLQVPSLSAALMMSPFPACRALSGLSGHLVFTGCCEQLV